VGQTRRSQSWRQKLRRGAGAVAARLPTRRRSWRRATGGRSERVLRRLLLGLTLVVTLFVAWPASASGRHRAILDAILLVESGGRDDCPDGDGGKAIGPYQIHRVYWEDAVKHAPELGRGRDYQACRQRAYAEQVITAYMQKWVPEAWRRGDAEVIARTHNGGPQGARNHKTDGYWERVRRRLGGARAGT
jgi:hypothetical protein